MDQVDQNVAANVRRLRELAGLKQAELVDQLRKDGLEDWHPTTLSRTESGERPVRLSEAHVLARVLGVSVADLGIGFSPEARAVEDMEASLQYVARTRAAYVTALGEYVGAWQAFVHLAREVGKDVGSDSALTRRVRAVVSRSAALKPSDDEVSAAAEAQWEGGDGRMRWDDDTVPPSFASQDGLQAR